MLPDDYAPAFEHQTFVHMADTDAAGVVYFPQQFDIAHRAYEAWLAQHGTPLGGIVRGGDYGLPVVHAEGDYRTPLFLGDALTVGAHVDRVGTSSVLLRYVIRRGGETVGVVRLTHVCVDGATRKPMPVPDALPFRAACLSA